MKKFFALAVLFAAVTMVSCCGQNKKAKDAEQTATECCAECSAEEATCNDACCGECADKKECKDECCGECQK